MLFFLKEQTKRVLDYIVIGIAAMSILSAIVINISNTLN